MKINEIKPDPLICPLCGKPNYCLSRGSEEMQKLCWCHDPSIVFPKELLAQIPSHLKGKACICKSCVLKYQAE